MTPAKNDRVQQLVQSLLVETKRDDDDGGGDDDRKPYMMLMQHSQAFSLRQEQHNTADTAVYRRAGIRTPQENAATDWQAGALWLEHLVATALITQSTTTVHCLQTLPQRRTPLFQKLQTRDGVKRVHVIDCCDGGGPFGWDDDDDGESGFNLELLDSVIAAVKERLSNMVETCVLMVESITPIVMRHGLKKTIIFLQRLQTAVSSSCRLMVIPVLRETLTAVQHRSLEDISNAVLSLNGGEAVLLRRGIRERGNVMRDSLPYRIVNTGEKKGTRCIELMPPSAEIIADGTAADAAIGLSSLSISDSAAVVPDSPVEPPRRRKVNLQVDEGSRDVAAAVETPLPQPNIFMQDDDPEFDDFDEEDPDDDLYL